MTVEIVNPATGKVEYRHELLDGSGIEVRLQAAADAFPAWSARSLQDRADVLEAIAMQLRGRRQDIQQAMTAEMGKLKAEALAEIEKCAQACEYYAGHATDYLRPQVIGGMPGVVLAGLCALFNLGQRLGLQLAHFRGHRLLDVLASTAQLHGNRLQHVGAVLQGAGRPCRECIGRSLQPHFDATAVQQFVAVFHLAGGRIDDFNGHEGAPSNRPPLCAAAREPDVAAGGRPRLPGLRPFVAATHRACRSRLHRRAGGQHGHPASLPALTLRAFVSQTVRAPAPWPGTRATGPGPSHRSGNRTMDRMLASSLPGIGRSTTPALPASAQSYPGTGKVMEVDFGNMVFEAHFEPDGRTMRFQEMFPDPSAPLVTVEYKSVEIAPKIYMLSWIKQPPPRASVVHIQNWNDNQVFSGMTTTDIELIRLQGHFKVLRNLP